jgi:hypothetical protein
LKTFHRRLPVRLPGKRKGCSEGDRKFLPLQINTSEQTDGKMH